MTVDQLFLLRSAPARPATTPRCRGSSWRGSGAHPGGGVFGVPGRNGARTVLRTQGGSAGGMTDRDGGEEQPELDHGLIEPLSHPPDSLVPDPATGTSNEVEYDLYFQVVGEDPGCSPGPAAACASRAS